MGIENNEPAKNDIDIDPFAIPIGRRTEIRANSADVTIGSLHGFLAGIRFETGSKLRIKISIGQVPIWGGAENEGVLIDGLKLIDFFGQNWGRLWVEEFPFGVIPGRPSLIKRALALAAKADTLRAPGHEVHRVVGDFVRSHVLEMIDIESKTALPRLWFVRSGTAMRVDAEYTDVFSEYGIGDVMDTLEKVCIEISSELKKYENSKKGRDPILVQWENRNRVRNGYQLVEAYTGIHAAAVVKDIVANDIDPSTIEELLFHKSEVLAAARMSSGKLIEQDARTLIQNIRTIQKGSIEKVDKLAQKVAPALEQVQRLAPFIQGHRVANSLREYLEIDGFVDVEGMLTDWGVAVKNIELDTPALDAIAIWGPKYGPAVLINMHGLYSRNSGGRRATLAHEICHLLVDRQRSLPLADVIGGHVPIALEQRARAFAAELLLPRRIAWTQFVQCEKDVTGARVALDSLIKNFGVSRSLAAWQILNASEIAEGPMSIEVLEYLKSVATHYVDVPFGGA